MIDNNSIVSLKNSLDIVEVISRYLELKQNGANFKANCPFHTEKTASFIVNPSKQIYHCFGCGKSGDTIDFVMEYEHLNYPEAIEKLAQTYNITLQYTNDLKKNDKKILEKLNLFFKKNLDINNKAKEYLYQRGVLKSSIEKFNIGYAPSNSQTMEFFKQNFFSLDELKEVGVIAFNENKEPYARFIERITFPIYSHSDKIIGFGGRTISNHPAKYINSPSSNIFNKSKLFYGFNIAKESIYKNREIIITEGYLDVVMLHQAGFNNSVATLGTALTNEHTLLLDKLYVKVKLAYDGDSAGRAAAFKASHMLAIKKVVGGVVFFPTGKDPADMVQDKKIDVIKKLFSQTKTFIEFSLEEIVNRYDIKNPLLKDKALVEAKRFLSLLSPLLQEEYKYFLASILGINYNLVNAANNNINTITEKKEDIVELSIIKTLLNEPALIDVFLDMVDIKIFQRHQYELVALLNENFSNPLLDEISIRNDIKILTNDDLIKQVKMLLIRYYERELQKIVMFQTSFKEKSFAIRKIRNNLEKLKEVNK